MCETGWRVNASAFRPTCRKAQGDSLLLAAADEAARRRLGKRTPLMFAALHGDLPRVLAHLEAGALVGTADKHQQAALHYAIKGGHAEVVQLLLERGAKLHPDELLLSARHGRVAVAQLLLDRGIDVNAFGYVRSGDTFLSGLKRTALHEAAAAGTADVARLLLAHGADPKVSMAEGRSRSFTALSLAMDTESKLNRGPSLTHKPDLSGVVRALLAHGAVEPSPANVVWAARQLDVALVSELLAAARAPPGSNAASGSVSDPRDLGGEALTSLAQGPIHCIDALQTLLAAGVRADGEDGAAALVFVCTWTGGTDRDNAKGGLAWATIILEAGAQVTTAALIAAVTIGGSKADGGALLKLLLANCPSPERLNGRIHVRGLVRSNYYDPPLSIADIHTAIRAEACGPKGAPAVPPARPGSTPLEAACAGGDNYAARLLLSRGAEPTPQTVAAACRHCDLNLFVALLDATGMNGNTVIPTAADASLLDISLASPNAQDKAVLLMQRGAMVLPSMLLKAAARAWPNAVAALLDRGVPVDTKDSNGDTVVAALSTPVDRRHCFRPSQTYMRERARNRDETIAVLVSRGATVPQPFELLLAAIRRDSTPLIRALAARFATDFLLLLTPDVLVASCGTPHIDVVRLLVEHVSVESLFAPMEAPRLFEDPRTFHAGHGKIVTTAGGVLGTSLRALSAATSGGAPPTASGAGRVAAIVTQSGGVAAGSQMSRGDGDKRKCRRRKRKGGGVPSAAPDGAAVAVLAGAAVTGASIGAASATRSVAASSTSSRVGSSLAFGSFTDIRSGSTASNAEVSCASGTGAASSLARFAAGSGGCADCPGCQLHVQPVTVLDTALCSACANGTEEIARYLLECGAVPSVLAFRLATLSGQTAIVELVLTRNCPWGTVVWAPFELVAVPPSRAGQPERPTDAKALVCRLEPRLKSESSWWHKGNAISTLTHVLCSYAGPSFPKAMDILKLLLRHGCVTAPPLKPNFSEVARAFLIRRGATLPHPAATLFEACGMGDAAVAAAILGCFPRLNLNTLRNAENRSPLTAAARYGHVRTVRLLLSEGMNINSKDGSGKMALEVALDSGSGTRINTACLLLQLGASRIESEATGRGELREIWIPHSVQDLMDKQARAKPTVPAAPLSALREPAPATIASASSGSVAHADAGVDAGPGIVSLVGVRHGDRGTVAASSAAIATGRGIAEPDSGKLDGNQLQVEKSGVSRPLKHTEDSNADVWHSDVDSRGARSRMPITLSDTIEPDYGYDYEKDPDYYDMVDRNDPDRWRPYGGFYEP